MALAPIFARADVGPPVHLRITEREAGEYRVQWRVPKALPARAAPTPLLPEGCSPIAEPTIVDQPAAWIFTREWRCDESLAGQEIGMRFPFRELALTTVIRVELLSGDRFAQLLMPDEESWLLPEGTAAPDLVRTASRAVQAGAGHAMGSWIHLAFLLTLGLFGGMIPALRLVSAFTAGQLLATAFVVVTGFGLVASPAEIGFALGIALLAREALRPDDARRSLLGLTAAAGAVHGLGTASILSDRLGDGAAGLVSQLLAILGMDAVHLVGAVSLVAALSWMTRRLPEARGRGAIAYGMGAASMALALGIALGGGVDAARAGGPSLVIPGAPTDATAGGVGSGRVAPAAPNAPVQSFLDIQPYEVRHEVLLRLSALTDELDLDPAATLDVSSQTAVVERLAELVVGGTSITVDGESPTAVVRRSDFITVDATGALPRPNPVPEPVAEALVGVVIAYPTGAMPDEVSLAWVAFPGDAEAIPATVLDPESVASWRLDPGAPSLVWENALMEDPVPTVEAVEVEPVRLPIPIVALPFFVIAAILLVGALRGRRSPQSLAAARVVLALGFVLGPVVQTAVAVPGSAGRTPSERQARRILSGLLPNIYRALEFRDEGMIYDRLAVSVTGETLTEVYLEQRRALEMEERGGAQARVEAVEVLEAMDIRSLENGFDVEGIWTVGGMVTHFGHRHFRQNRYDARIEVVPVDGSWKIGSIETLEQERVR